MFSIRTWKRFTYTYIYIYINIISIVDLARRSEALDKYLPLMQQEIIIINIAMRTKGPAGINIFKFDSARARH